MQTTPSRLQRCPWAGILRSRSSSVTLAKTIVQIFRPSISLPLPRNPSSTAAFSMSAETTGTQPAGTPPSSDFPPAELVELLTQVSSLLRERKETLSVVETACGGLLSSALLSQPGASQIYRGGLTLYTLPSRIAYGGWTEEHIANYKGPNTEIVTGLAKKARGDLESTYAVAESGTAGPTGGATPNRRPGYVALAVDCERGTFTRELNTELAGARVGNMVRFAAEALRLLRDVLNDEAKL